MFSYEYWEISKNTCFQEYLHTTASAETLGNDCLGLSFWRVGLKTILISNITKIPLLINQSPL